MKKANRITSTKFKGYYPTLTIEKNDKIQTRKFPKKDISKGCKYQRARR